MDFQQWLSDRNIDCETLTPELLVSLTQQYEQDCQRSAPPAEVMVVNDNCPPKTHRLPVPTQMTLFDTSPEYK